MVSILWDGVSNIYTKFGGVLSSPAPCCCSGDDSNGSSNSSSSNDIPSCESNVDCVFWYVRVTPLLVFPRPTGCGPPYVGPFDTQQEAISYKNTYGACSNPRCYCEIVSSGGYCCDGGPNGPGCYTGVCCLDACLYAFLQEECYEYSPTGLVQVPCEPCGQECSVGVVEGEIGWGCYAVNSSGECGNSSSQEYLGPGSYGTGCYWNECNAMSLAYKSCAEPYPPVPQSDPDYQPHCTG